MSTTGQEPAHGRAPVRGETIVEALRENARLLADAPALRRRTDGGTWETWTWGEYGAAVAEVLAGLVELGIGPGDHIAILSSNRVEWHFADHATLANGGVTVPIYQTSSAEQVRYILDNGEVRACFVENSEQLAKVLQVRHDLPKLDRVVVFDEDSGTTLDDPFLIGMDALGDIGRAQLQREPGLFDTRAAAVVPAQLATLVYTSGTTGPPRAR